MEIEKAIDFTFSALTLNEKGIAAELLNSARADKLSASAYIRSPCLRFNDAVAKARELARQSGFSVRSIGLYCDTLILEENASISPEKRPDGSIVTFELEIYTRAITRDPKLPTTGSKPGLNVNIASGGYVLLWTAKPPDMYINFTTSSGSKFQQMPAAEAGPFGVLYDGDSSEVTVTPMDAPGDSMKTINYLSLINEDGTVRDQGVLSDDLPRLLLSQLLIAQAHISTNKPLAIQLLTFICAASAAPESFNLFSQAQTLLLSLSIESTQVAVPSVNVYQSKQILKSRLVAALAFEEAFREFNQESRERGVQSTTAMNLVAKSTDAMQTYAFLYELRLRDYNNAVKANDEAQKNFSTRQGSLEDLSKKFEDGIEAWKDEQTRAATRSIIKAIVAVGIAVAATVATAGAAAPAVAGTVGAVGKAASGVAKIVAQLKEVFEKLKEIYEKLKPVLEKIKVVVDTVKEVVGALQGFKDATSPALLLKKPKSVGTDVVNATAEWRRFDITVRDLEMSLAQYGIPGKSEYFQALKMLVVDGEAFILTQANLGQKGDELATVMIQQRMEGRDQARLQAASRQVEVQASVVNLLRRAMFDRILAVRTLVYLDFQTYLSAYRYHTLSDESLVFESPVKPVVDYLEDNARLQGAISSFGSKIMVQQRTFNFKSLCGFSTPQELADAVVRGQSLALTIRPDDPAWAAYGRIRVSRTRCYLEGARTSTVGIPFGLRLELRTNGQFFDLPYQPAEAQAGAGAHCFVGDSRALVFEYLPGDGTIVCDGNYGLERDYTKHTPITTWLISVASDQAVSRDTLAAADLDFSNFTGIRLELLCEFTWKGAFRPLAMGN